MIAIYEVDEKYIDYLLPFAPHLFHNKKQSQKNQRKYVGVIFEINEVKYFAPLSSFKSKHIKMKETVDFIKLKDMAVININNMFPVPDSCYSYVDFTKIIDIKYKSLLMNEYRIIRVIQDKIRKNAKVVYKHKINNNNTTSLGKRCNDFMLLEAKCKKYIKE